MPPVNDPPLVKSSAVSTAAAAAHAGIDDEFNLVSTRNTKTRYSCLHCRMKSSSDTRSTRLSLSWEPSPTRPRTFASGLSPWHTKPCPTSFGTRRASCKAICASESSAELRTNSS
jgi:hypothetical protein